MRRVVGVLVLLAAAAPLASVHAASLQATVLDEDGKPVAGAAVYAVPTTPDLRAPRNASIDQVNRQFVPQMMVVQRGAMISFPNSDNVRHSVYSFSEANRFTLKLYAGTAAPPVKFPNTGIVALGCNIHDKMVAWVLVVDTPFFGRTDASGKLGLNGLAPDKSTGRAWRPKMREEPAGEAVRIAADTTSVELHVPVDADAGTLAMAGMADMRN